MKIWNRDASATVFRKGRDRRKGNAKSSSTAAKELSSPGPAVDLTKEESPSNPEEDGSVDPPVEPVQKTGKNYKGMLHNKSQKKKDHIELDIDDDETSYRSLMDAVFEKGKTNVIWLERVKEESDVNASYSTASSSFVSTE